MNSLLNISEVIVSLYDVIPFVSSLLGCPTTKYATKFFGVCVARQRLFHNHFIQISYTKSAN